MTHTHEFYINLNERGQFYADVRKFGTDDTVFEIHGAQIFEDGFMNNIHDMHNLADYLVDLSILTPRDTILYRG